MSTNISLNPLQIAYLIGRTNYLPLGGVAMHDFREYRGNIDVEILKQNLLTLVEKHAVLRTLINPKNYTQSISLENQINFEEINISNQTWDEASLQVDKLRNELSHYRHDLSKSPWQIFLIHLPFNKKEGYSNILWVSFDALIIDGYSISALMSELLSNYLDAVESEKSNFNEPSIEYLDSTRPQYSKGKKIDDKKPVGQEVGSTNYLSKIDFFTNKPEDEQYWRNKLADLSTTPKFPWKQDLESIKSSRFQREFVIIAKGVWTGLIQKAAQYNLLPNTIINAVILEILSGYTVDNNKDIYVAVPISFSQYGTTLENKSTMVPIILQGGSINSFIDRAVRIQQDTFDALEHISFSGVEIARLICDQLKTSIPFPVVITNGLSWEPSITEENLFYYSGQTQTPQVAIDIRASFTPARHLEISVDYASDAVDTSLIKDILKDIECKFRQLYHENNWN